MWRLICILLISCFFAAFQSQAEIPNANLNSNILSGEKKRIGSSVSDILHLLEKNDSLHPRYFKIKETGKEEFLQRLKSADLNEGDGALLEISEAYLYSANKVYKELILYDPFNQFATFSIINDFNDLFDYLAVEQRADTMLREYYTALLFSSYAGFFSKNGKALYIISLKRFQNMYDFLNQIPKTLRKTFHLSKKNNFVEEPNGQAGPFFKKDNFATGQNKQAHLLKMPNFLKIHFDKIKDFSAFLWKLQKIHSKVVIPAFKELGWVQKDLQTYYDTNFSVFFEYGRMINQAYREKDQGILYIIHAAEGGYSPAVEYLLDYPPMKKKTYLNFRKKWMIQYLKASEPPLKRKLTVTRELLLTSMAEGQNPWESLENGIDSIKRSCQLIFNK